VGYQYPEGSVTTVETGTLHRTLEHSKLLPECEVLEEEVGVRRMDLPLCLRAEAPDPFDVVLLEPFRQRLCLQPLRALCRLRQRVGRHLPDRLQELAQAVVAGYCSPPNLGITRLMPTDFIRGMPANGVLDAR